MLHVASSVVASDLRSLDVMLLLLRCRSTTLDSKSGTAAQLDVGLCGSTE